MTAEEYIIQELSKLKAENQLLKKALSDTSSEANEAAEENEKYKKALKKVLKITRAEFQGNKSFNYLMFASNTIYDDEEKELIELLKPFLEKEEENKEEE